MFHIKQIFQFTASYCNVHCTSVTLVHLRSGERFICAILPVTSYTGKPVLLAFTKFKIQGASPLWAIFNSPKYWNFQSEGIKAEQFQQLWQILSFVKSNFQELFQHTSWFLTTSKLKLPEECLRGAKQTQQLPLTLLQFSNRRRVSFQFNTSCKNVSNYKLYVKGGLGDGPTQLQESVYTFIVLTRELSHCLKHCARKVFIQYFVFWLPSPPGRFMWQWIRKENFD